MLTYNLILSETCYASLLEQFLQFMCTCTYIIYKQYMKYIMYIYFLNIIIKDMKNINKATILNSLKLSKDISSKLICKLRVPI